MPTAAFTIRESTRGLYLDIAHPLSARMQTRVILPHERHEQARQRLVRRTAGTHHHQPTNPTRQSRRTEPRPHHLPPASRSPPPSVAVATGTEAGVNNINNGGDAASEASDMVTVCSYGSRLPDSDDKYTTHCAAFAKTSGRQGLRPGAYYRGRCVGHEPNAKALPHQSNNRKQQVTPSGLGFLAGMQRKVERCLACGGGGSR